MTIDRASVWIKTAKGSSRGALVPIAKDGETNVMFTDVKEPLSNPIFYSAQGSAVAFASQEFILGAVNFNDNKF